MAEGRIESTQRSVERAAHAERVARERRRERLVTLAACMGWALAGLVAVLWSAHTTNARHGWIAVYAGVLLGNGGVIATLLNALWRGQDRGD